MTDDPKGIVALVQGLVERVDETPGELVPAVLAALAAAQARLAVRLFGQVAISQPPEASTKEDRLLSVSEAAARLGVTVKWVYRRANRLPFTKRLSAKTLRFSEAGLQRYLAKRP